VNFSGPLGEAQTGVISVLIVEQARYTAARLGDSSARCDEMAGRGRKSPLPWIKSIVDPRFPRGEVHRVAIMGLYERWIVPRLLDLAIRNRLLDRYREQTIETARGLVLEVGIGSGLNLPLYGPAVTRVVGVDPSPELLRLASKRTADAVVPVSLLRGSAEHVPFRDAVFDAIVMTWTLCSIPNPIAALTEMRRVLKPGGQLLFVEHGLSPEIRTALWQHRLTPYWKRISGGCHLDRKTDDLIRAAGFQIDARNGLYARPEAVDIHVSGIGEKRSSGA
jgi:SAM-dependent methyltransferase